MALSESPTETMAETPAKTLPSKPPLPLGFEEGTVIGRYIVLSSIGRGGIGAVMLAYDTQLARRVAVKVLLTRAAGEDARARMLREAQAMAQLAHPNVVTIFDVGTHDENIYLSMEYVEGETLSAWLKTPRKWRDIVRVMKQAGQGLAAAHAVGIIHRDFKPANVLLGSDGRVRVLDFGIATADTNEPAVAPTTSTRDAARVSAGPPPPPTSAPSLPHTPVTSSARTRASLSAPTPSTPRRSLPEVFGDKLTEEGAIVGTPGYFAPETVFDHVSDARSDVFSFSVALWRALYGRLPYPCTNLDEYLRVLCEKGPPSRPKDARVPAWLEQVVVKGLRRDPAQRYASMDEALRALDADPTKGRAVRAAGALAMVGAAAIGVGMMRHRGALRAACAAEGGAIVGDWRGREALRTAMLATDDPTAEDRTARVVRTLDSFVDEWRREQTSSCEATRIASTQPPLTHEKRSACLLGARQQFQVAVELLAQRDPAVQRKAMEVVRSIPPPHLCSGREADLVYVAPPSDPGARAAAQEARRLAARASVLRLSGRLNDGVAAAEQAVTLARQAGVHADEAVALLQLTLVLTDEFDNSTALGRAREALFVAERAGANRTAGLAASEAAFLLTERLNRQDEAAQSIDLATAKLERIGRDDELEIRILLSNSSLASNTNQQERALAVDARIQELVGARYGTASSLYCTALDNRGFDLNAGLHFEEGLETLRQAIACLETDNGPADPMLGLRYWNLAASLCGLRRYDEAADALHHALEVRRVLGTSDMLQLSLSADAAIAEAQAGHFAEAEADARRTLARMDDLKEPPPDVRVRCLYALGLARAGLGDFKGSKIACAGAVATDDATGQPTKDDSYSHDALRCLGEAEFALGDVPHAREHLERSVSLPNRYYVADLAFARFALARALVAPPAGDRARARKLAEDARDELRPAAERVPSLRPSLDAVEGWLAAQKSTP